MDALTSAFDRYRRCGDVDALGHVFDRLAPRLLGLALHLTGNPADAEDALQASFVVALQKAAEFDASQPVAPWLAGILAGEARNLARRERRRRAEPLPDRLAGDAGDGPAAAERHERIAQLRTRLDVLPEQQRQVLLLQLEHGLSPAEIAEVLQVPPGTVRMRIHRGLARLRHLLPASLGFAGAALAGPRGLAAVRSAVLEAGRTHAAAAGLLTTTTTLMLGGAVTKKILATAAAAAVVLLCWFTLRAPGPVEVPGDAPGAGVGRAAAALPSSGARDSALRLDAEHTDAVERAAVAATGGVDVIVRSGADDGDHERPAEVASTGDGGDAVAGAFLRLWSDVPGRQPEPTEVMRRRAGNDGRGRFDDLAPGSYRLQVYAAGQAQGTSRAIRVRAGERAQCEIQLGARRVVRGIVIDASGHPVAGASILVGGTIPPVGANCSYEGFVRRAAVSDGSGRFEVACLRSEQFVAADRDGYAPSRSHPVAQLGEGRVRLVLGANAGGVRGVLLDDSGAPHVGASIALQEASDRISRDVDGSLQGPRLAAVGRSDVRGLFSFPSVAPGRYVCRAWLPPHGVAEQIVEVLGGAVTEVELRLARRAIVYGFVRTPDGEPCAQTYVQMTLPDGATRPAMTAADGSFVFENVDAEPFELVARKAGCATVVTRKCAAPASPRERVDLELDVGASIAGTARTRSGRALAKWIVSVSNDDGSVASTDVVDENGAFELWGLEAGEHEVRLTRTMPDAVHTVRARAGAPLELVVDDELSPVGVVRGRMVDPDGVALSGVDGAWVDSEVAQRATGRNPVDEHGQFRFENVPPGQHTFYFSAPGFVRLVRSIDLDGRPELDLGDVALARAATLRVRYQRPDGLPWTARPPVPWLQRDNGTFLVTGEVRYAVDEGDVVVTGIPPGRYDVLGPQGDELLIEPVAVELVAGQTRRLTLQARVGRRCMIVFEVDEPKAAATTLHVVARRGDGVVLVERDIEAGTGKLVMHALLPFGDYTIEARNEDGMQWRTQGSVAEQAVGEVRIDVPRTR